MSTRTCPVCDKICDGYKDECIGEGCGDVPCNHCATPEKSHVIPICYNDWVDVDTEVDLPE